MRDDNIREAIGEASFVLENARAVNGPKFAKFVAEMINAGSLSRLIGELCESAPAVERSRGASKVAMIIMNKTMTDLAWALGLSEAEVSEALSLVKVMDDRVQAAGRSA